ncbi:MAG: hypothetical protein AW07_02784 [Candidatus Accumulibacter sp. SK-11]|nr:MAG: hypothetical protein AW07_02784 [Candidatus Accumulibacter sp. SK-11]
MFVKGPMRSRKSEKPVRLVWVVSGVKVWPNVRVEPWPKYCSPPERTPVVSILAACAAPASRVAARPSARWRIGRGLLVVSFMAPASWRPVRGARHRC